MSLQKPADHYTEWPKFFVIEMPSRAENIELGKIEARGARYG